jgi:FKBP-type peptidyl-prolyl cis-trans isomerase
MRLPAVVSLALLALTPFFLENAVAADTAEVPHPQLPAGAGKLDADAPKVFASTPSGLQYRVLRKGAGANPKATDAVKVNYHGWLDDGKVFDSSYKRGEAIEFGLNQVIPGWTEGMQLVGKGGMIELVIPSNLGYGPRGTPGGPIPPNATLHFLVELLEVR